MDRATLMNPNEHPAAGYLADVLADLDDKRIVSLAGRLYNKLDESVRELSAIHSKGLREFCIAAVHDKVLKQLEEAAYVPPLARSLIQNILKTRVRMARQGDNRNHFDRKREKYGWKPEE